MSTSHRALADQQQRRRRQLHIGSLSIAREGSDVAESSSTELHPQEKSTSRNTADSASAQRIVAQCRRLHPTAVYLLSCRGRGPARRWRKPLPWVSGPDTHSPEGTSDNDNGSDGADVAALSECAQAAAAAPAAAMRSLGATCSSASTGPPPPAYDTLFATHGLAPTRAILTPGVSSLSNAVDADSSLRHVMDIPASIRALVASSRTAPGPFTRRVKFGHSERQAALQLLDRRDWRNHWRNGVLVRMATRWPPRWPPWGIDDDLDQELSVLGADVEELYSQKARMEWWKLESAWRQQPWLRRFVFEKPFPAMEPSELREVIDHLRPNMLAKYSSRWASLLELATAGPGSESARVLELVTQALVLLLGNGISDDELLDPQALAAMATLVKLLHLSPQQLHHLKEYQYPLAKAALELRDAVRAARLADMPYMHLGPSQLYHIVCMTPPPEPVGSVGTLGPSESVGPFGPFGASGSAAAARWAPGTESTAGAAARYSPQHFVAMLQAVVPERYAVELAEASWVMMFSGPRVRELRDTYWLPRESVDVMVDVQAVRASAWAKQQAARALPATAAAPSSSAGAAAIGAAETEWRARAGLAGPHSTSMAADALDEIGLYDSLYMTAVRANQRATTCRNAQEAQFSVQAQLLNLTERLLRCLEYQGLMDAPLPGDDPGRVDQLRDLLRRGVAEAVALGYVDGGGRGRGSLSPALGLRLLAEADQARWTVVLGTASCVAKSLMDILHGNTSPKSIIEVHDLVMLESCRRHGGDSGSSAGSSCSGVDGHGGRFSGPGGMVRLVDSLRPGLLDAHPATWGMLLGRAEAGAGAALRPEEETAYDLAIDVLSFAIVGLALLKGQELPLEHIRLSHCLVAGGVCMCNLMTRTDPHVVDEQYLRRLLPEAKMAFYWLAFVPRVLQLLPPEDDWAAPQVATKARRAAAIAEAEAKTLGAAVHAGTGAGGGATAFPGAVLGLQGEHLLLCLSDFLMLSQNVKTLITAHMTRCGLERARNQRQDVPPSGSTSMGGGRKQPQPQRQQQEGREPWPLPWFAHSQRMFGQNAEAVVARGVAVLSFVIRDDDDEDPGDLADSFLDESNALKREEWGEIEEEEEGDGLRQRERWAEAPLERTPGQAGRWWAQQMWERDALDSTARGVGRTDYMYRADQKVQVKSRVLSRAPATAAESSSVRPLGGAAYSSNPTCSAAASASAANRHGVKGPSRGRGTASDIGVGDRGGTGGCPYVLEPQASISDVFPLLQLCMPPLSGALGSTATDGPAVGPSGARDLVLEGGEAAALLLLLLHSAAQGKIVDGGAFQLAEGGAGSGSGTAAAGAVAGAAVTSAASSKAPAKGAKKGPAAAPEQQQEQLRLSLWPGHSVDALMVDDTRNMQQFTVTAGSKLAQQAKLVKKALLDEQKGVYELHAVGVEGIWKALRLALQVCEDMRAVQRDLLIQATHCTLELEDSDSDSEGGGCGVQARSRERRQQQREQRMERRRMAEERLKTALGEVLQSFDHLMLAAAGGLEGPLPGELFCFKGRGDQILAWLWSQLQDASGGSSSSGTLRSQLCFNLLLVECRLRQPWQLATRSKGSGGQGGPMSRHEARRQLESKMMSRQ